MTLLTVASGCSYHREGAESAQGLFENSVKFESIESDKIALMVNGEVRNFFMGDALKLVGGGGDEYIFTIIRIDKELKMINVRYVVRSKDLTLNGDYEENQYRNFHMRFK